MGVSEGDTQLLWPSYGLWSGTVAADRRGTFLQLAPTMLSGLVGLLTLISFVPSTPATECGLSFKDTMWWAGVQEVSWVGSLPPLPTKGSGRIPQEDGGGSEVTQQQTALKQHEEWRTCVLSGKPRRAIGKNPEFQAAFETQLFCENSVIYINFLRLP